jgi:hypothetical protein
MKFYIEIETTNDKLDMIAFDEVLRQIKSITVPYRYISDRGTDQRIVFCYAHATDQSGGVVTAALVNKVDR